MKKGRKSNDRTRGQKNEREMRIEELKEIQDSQVGNIPSMESLIRSLQRQNDLLDSEKRRKKERETNSDGRVV